MHGGTCGFRNLVSEGEIIGEWACADEGVDLVGELSRELPGFDVFKSINVHMNSIRGFDSSARIFGASVQGCLERERGDRMGA